MSPNQLAAALLLLVVLADASDGQAVLSAIVPTAIAQRWFSPSLGQPRWTPIAIAAT